MGTARDDLDLLLAHAGWARALARSLVRGDDRADDLVQRAWLAALRRPPEDDVPPRRWLAAVMRNLVRDDAREAARRDRREREVARAERVDDGLDDAAEAQARLLAAVRELPEPLRATVWSRYYEGIAPREIAARDGVPLATVKTRLARGLAALRAKFDREHGGDRAAWVALFLPLAESRHAGAVTLGALLVKTKIQVGLLVLAATCAVGAWWIARDGAADVDARDAELAAEAGMTVAARDAALAPSEPTADAERRSASTAAMSATTASPADSATHPRQRRGRVVDLAGHPVAGVGVHEGWRADPADSAPHAITDADGRFEVTIADGARDGYFETRDASWCTVYAGRHAPEVGLSEVTVVVAPLVRFAGVVLGPSGDPVAGVEVDVELSADERRRLAPLAANALELVAGDLTDDLGRFEIDRAPALPGELVAARGRAQTARIALPRASIDDLVLQLAAPAPDVVTLRGRVLDERGDGVPDAYVGAAGRATRSVGGGEFSLEIARGALESETSDGALVLIAAAEGRLTGRRALSAAEALACSVDGRGVDLLLGGEALAMSGRVVDARGEPIEHAEVEILDAERLGTSEVSFSGSLVEMHVTVEGATSGSWVPRTATDASGAFELTGLQERAYTLRVHSGARSLRVQHGPVQAGARDVRVVLDDTTPTVRAGGIVVDGAGTAVVGAVVTSWITLAGFTGTHEGPRAMTDSEGRFTLRGLRGTLARVGVEAAGYGHSQRTLHPGESWTEIRIVARRQRYLQVDCTAEDSGVDSVRFEDERGVAIHVTLVRSVATTTGSSAIYTSRSDVPVAGGRSDVALVEEQPLTAVFLKGADVVARAPVVFASEGTTTVRP